MSIDDAERTRQHALFDDYHRTRDLAVRDQLAVANLRLALHLARRFANRGIATDDLEQVASLALLRSIDRFDPDRGLEFSTFATPTIVGELKRHFRDRAWAVRVPRRIQELHLELNGVVADLTQQLGRSPTISELATATRASEEQILEAMEAAQAYRSVSIDPGGTGPDEAALGAMLGVDDHGLSEAENRVLVEELLSHLPARDQLLLRLRFFEEMSQHQIAHRLGVSQMHVSRLLARCLGDLRRRVDVAQR